MQTISRMADVWVNPDKELILNSFVRPKVKFLDEKFRFNYFFFYYWVTTPE